ncbi:AAA domain-containing protein [Campylobacter upsaliensis]|uniref:Putative DNA helicase n=1 Tax=Campylobacter upsaliensis TaxID=28080 RepID=A0A381EKH7_CAMUP|nr:AAA domain-containing protein [Campylobacter upsaliensis]SUX27488.1 putative DNA helicase [Campylobacter upsaliensis]
MLNLKKDNTQVPNLLRKINKSTELKENKQREIESYFNEDLDENQQEAVRKALSLERECEILLIQGPPGMGKTTTITEIVKQCGEDKLFRIGNNEEKMSEIAKQYTPEKVLD